MPQKQKLELKLSQKLILTPQLQQSIKLLQLPLLELSQNLTHELMENPLLEEITERDYDERNESTTTIEEEPFQETSDDIEAPLEKIFGFTTENYFEDRGSDGRDLGYFNEKTEIPSNFERNKKALDLYEHLLWQLRLSRASELIGKTAEIIIYNLNKDGYLEASLEEIVKIAQVDMKTAEEALSLIHEFDPPGVGARKLQECLLLQLKLLNLKKTLAGKILTNGFAELERRKFKQLAAKFKTTFDAILTAVKIIEGLEPRPGRNYSSEEAVHITPDVYVEESDGKFIISLNDRDIPKLRLSNYYRKLLFNKNTLDSEEKHFLKEKLRSALWLLKSLDMRNKTIYRVTESILKFQEDFFRRGLEYLKPLNLKDVAEDLGMHESTISRVTSNKYLQCSQGLVSFRSFFSNAVSSTKGAIPSTTVKNVIKQLISNENPQKPFSDQKIVNLLKSKGIDVARRTVAKYRENLRILSHSKRRKWV